MNILFRVDASSTIGLGHLMRCFVLVKQLDKQYTNSKILFAMLNPDDSIIDMVTQNSYGIYSLKTNDVNETIQLVQRENINFLVIDNYSIDYNYESIIKEKTDITSLSFDDTYEKHNCDILLNHNICANEERYKNLVPSNCELRCGAKYTLIREEFINEKENKRKSFDRNDIKILLAMGGTDHSNINIQILKSLHNIPNISINIITTNANKNLHELQIYCQNKSNINLHINTTSIAKLMNNCDFGIISPSVIANEATFMKLPFIAIKTTSNQEEMYNYLLKNNIQALSSFNEIVLKNEIESQIWKLSQ